MINEKWVTGKPSFAGRGAVGATGKPSIARGGRLSAVVEGGGDVDVENEGFPTITEGACTVPAEVVHIHEEEDVLGVVLLGEPMFGCDVLDETVHHHLCTVEGLGKSLRIGVFGFSGIEVKFKGVVLELVTKTATVMDVHHGGVEDEWGGVLQHIHLGSKAVAKEASVLFLWVWIFDMQMMVHAFGSPCLEIFV